MNVTEAPFAGVLLVPALIVLIVLSMLFSAAESAFLSVNKLRIRFLRDKKHKAAVKAGKLLDDKEKLLNTVLAGNNTVNVLLSVLLTASAVALFGEQNGSKSIFAASAVSTVLLLIFGEIVPKTLASRRPESTAFKLAPFISVCAVLLHPPVVFFTAVCKHIIKLFGIQTQKNTVSFSEEEIKTFIEVGEEEGLIHSGGKKMMRRVFTFTDLEAQDIMVPRTEIVAVKQTDSYTSVLELSQKSRLSRFPVLGIGIDDIRGILYMKDVLLYSGDTQLFEIKKIMREPLFILKTKSMSTVRQLLYEKRQSIAIVLDEYSGTAGLLTKENITSQIFGNIGDEYRLPEVYDVQENAADGIQKNVQPGAQSEMIVDGKTRLIDLSETLGTQLHSDFNETVAGFVMEKLDKVPAAGDSFVYEGWCFSVCAVAGLRVRSIGIKAAEHT